MRFFEPVLQLGVLLAPQTRLEEKFGGLPWGLPPERWPRCTACGNPQTLIAQLIHDAQRLDLGAPGRVLFVFQCDYNPGSCETWAARSGANACVILEAADIGSGLTSAPAAATPVETEVRVMGWTAADDGVPPEMFDAFFDDARLGALDPAVRDGVPIVTKAGSAPTWIQSAGEGPDHPWRFALQFDSSHRFRGKPPTADAVGATVTRTVGDDYQRWEPRVKKAGAPPWIHVDDDDAYNCGAANYGDAGIAYIFLRTDVRPPEGVFFWQCG
jgi:hypothetical protein